MGLFIKNTDRARLVNTLNLAPKTTTFKKLHRHNGCTIVLCATLL